jgi:hypothetical protein
MRLWHNTPEPFFLKSLRKTTLWSPAQTGLREVRRQFPCKRRWRRSKVHCAYMREREKKKSPHTGGAAIRHGSKPKLATCGSKRGCSVRRIKKKKHSLRRQPATHNKISSAWRRRASDRHSRFAINQWRAATQSRAGARCKHLAERRRARDFHLISRCVCVSDIERRVLGRAESISGFCSREIERVSGAPVLTWAPEPFTSVCVICLWMRGLYVRTARRVICMSRGNNVMRNQITFQGNRIFRSLKVTHLSCVMEIVGRVNVNKILRFFKVWHKFLLLLARAAEQGIVPKWYQ